MGTSLIASADRAALFVVVDNAARPSGRHDEGRPEPAQNLTDFPHAHTLNDVMSDALYRSPVPSPAVTRSVDRLSIFTFLWACQALVHQEFYSKWLGEGNVFGWILTVAALATLNNPRSLFLFVMMLAASIAYNVVKWPFVVNHILVETLINFTILAAIIWTLFASRKVASKKSTAGQHSRDQIYDRFAPVLKAMMVIMYYFAFIAKLNVDFFDVDLSCVSFMYGDLVRRIPFIPTADWAKSSAIWSTIAIEAAIPILLTFRRTRYAGVAIGMPFHLMLGLIGHRTFSALAFALYALFLMTPLQIVVQRQLTRISDHFGNRWNTIVTLLRVLTVSGVIFLLAADLSGNYRAGYGPFLIYRFAWGFWILWSCMIAWLYFSAMTLHFMQRHDWRAASPTAKPQWLWAICFLVCLNGSSQYLGLKTETCFTMYSNLRTEGRVNNHLFMPALRLAGYQDDLVEILETNDPELKKLIDQQQLITFFEFQSRLGTQRDTPHLTVTYVRDGQVSTFTRLKGTSNDKRFDSPPPLILRKLLFFRPVPKSDRCACQH